MDSLAPEKDRHWPEPPGNAYEAIGDTGMVGRVYRGLIWLRGPCGQEHCLSFAEARKVAAWLLRESAPVIEGKAENVQDG
jgi:hypothetical protein